MSNPQSLFDKLTIPPLIRDALADGFDLVISISGGKDSDTMARLLVALHRRHKWSGRLCLLHSDLGRAEHLITPRYVHHFADQLDVPLHVIDGGDLVDIMQARMHKLQAEGRDVPFWPSAKARYCTSSAKRDPLSKHLRNWAGKEGRVLCAIGGCELKNLVSGLADRWFDRVAGSTQSPVPLTTGCPSITSRWPMCGKRSVTRCRSYTKSSSNHGV